MPAVCLYLGLMHQQHVLHFERLSSVSLVHNPPDVCADVEAAMASLQEQECAGTIEAPSLRTLRL